MFAKKVLPSTLIGMGIGGIMIAVIYGFVTGIQMLATNIPLGVGLIGGTSVMSLALGVGLNEAVKKEE